MANTYLTLNQITSETIILFKNSNTFIANLNLQYEELYEKIAVEPINLSTKEIVILGAAAIICKNPITSRRFWSSWFK